MPPGGGTPFSVGNAINWGWKKFTENVAPFLILMVIFGVVIGVLYGLMVGATIAFVGVAATTTTTALENGIEVTSVSTPSLLPTLLITLLFGVVVVLVGYYFQAGLIRGGLQVSQGVKPTLGSMLTFDKLGQIILGAVVLSLAYWLGQLLSGFGNVLLSLLAFVLYIVGIVIQFLGLFFVYFILDQNLGAIDAIKASAGLVRENLGKVLLIFLVAIGFAIVGTLVCCVGLLVAIPLVVLMMTFTFKTLRGVPVAP